MQCKLPFFACGGSSFYVEWSGLVVQYSTNNQKVTHMFRAYPL